MTVQPTEDTTRGDRLGQLINGGAEISVLTWLLDSDPPIRWQVMRDLADEQDAVVAAERSRVATEQICSECAGLD